jgi:hypothetical protein
MLIEEFWALSTLPSSSCKPTKMFSDRHRRYMQGDDEALYIFFWLSSINKTKQFINLLLLKGIGSVISIWILDGTAPSFWLLASERLGNPNPLTPTPKTPTPWPPTLKSSLISLANFWNLIKRLSLIPQKVTEAEHGAWKSSDRRAAKTGRPEAAGGQGAASKRLKRARGLPGRAERIDMI